MGKLLGVLDGVWNWGVLIVWLLGRLLEILLLSAEKEVIEYDRENKRTSNDFTWLMFDRQFILFLLSNLYSYLLNKSYSVGHITHKQTHTSYKVDRCLLPTLPLSSILLPLY